MLLYAIIPSVIYLRCQMQLQAKLLNKKRFCSSLLSNGGRNCYKRLVA